MMVVVPRMKRLAAFIILLGAVAAPLSATLVERLSLEQLAGRSERIVHGRCLRTWSAWDASHQAIWTHCEVDVVEPLKGGPAKTLVVSEPGGVVDGVEMTIDGVPRFEAGEEMVLFLYRVPNGLWRARGLGQGKYRVAANRVQSSLEGLALIDSVQPPSTRSTDLRRLDGLSLDRFKAAIRGALAR